MHPNLAPLQPNLGVETAPSPMHDSSSVSRRSWWQHRYESTDPDFELEFSDPEQNSDTEGGDMGDEDKLPGKPSPLKGVDDSSLEKGGKGGKGSAKEGTSSKGKNVAEGSSKLGLGRKGGTGRNPMSAHQEEEEEEEEEEDDDDEEGSDESDEDDEDDEDK